VKLGKKQQSVALALSYCLFVETVVNFAQEVTKFCNVSKATVVVCFLLFLHAFCFLLFLHAATVIFREKK